MLQKIATIIGGLGRVLIATGFLVLLFAGFQLWGTGFFEARAQSSLDQEFEERLIEAAALSSGAGAGPTVDTDQPVDKPVLEIAGYGPGPAKTLPALLPEEWPAEGDAVGRIEIPAIGVTKAFVQGVTRDVLRLGPGHYPWTPLPGQPGNAAIAGHRTTHGAPFSDIDQLQPGDEIVTETLQGRFIYVVEGHDAGAGLQVGHRIVSPSEVEVIGDQGDNRLTLTACHPKLSARERIIVTAKLISEAAPTTLVPAAMEAADEAAAQKPAELVPDIGGELTTGHDAPGGVTEESVSSGAVDPSNVIGGHENAIAESLGWQTEFATPTAIWAGLTALVALAGWALGRRWSRRPAYAIAVVPFVVALFYTFSNLDRFIPAI